MAGEVEARDVVGKDVALVDTTRCGRQTPSIIGAVDIGGVDVDVLAHGWAGQLSASNMPCCVMRSRLKALVLVQRGVGQQHGVHLGDDGKIVGVPDLVGGVLEREHATVLYIIYIYTMPCSMGQWGT